MTPAYSWTHKVTELITFLIHFNLKVGQPFLCPLNFFLKNHPPSQNLSSLLLLRFFYSSQAILREMEERDSPNRNAPQRSSQGPRVHRIIRTPQRTIIATRSPVQSQQQAVRPQVIRTISPQGRPQMIITSPNNCRSRAGDTYRTYCMIRSIVVIVVFVIVAIAAGIGASQHKDNKGSTSHSSYWNDDYSSGNRS